MFVCEYRRHCSVICSQFLKLGQNKGQISKITLSDSIYNLCHFQYDNHQMAVTRTFLASVVALCLVSSLTPIREHALVVRHTCGQRTKSVHKNCFTPLQINDKIYLHHVQNLELVTWKMNELCSIKYLVLVPSCNQVTCRAANFAQDNNWII